MPGPRIGYVPITQDLDGPGDRRRFVHYARRRGREFEIARAGRAYDLVVVTQGADLSVWRRYTRGRILFDTTDAYLAVPGGSVKGVLRGTAKALMGKNRHFDLSFRRTFAGMCQRADAIVCCSEEQRQLILPFGDNVHCILDFQNMAVRSRKVDYRVSSPFNLVWEGLADNVPSLGVIRLALERLAARHPIALHVVSEPGHFLFARRFGRRSTPAVLRRTLGRKTAYGVYFYEWNEQMLAAICCAADLAVIPVPLEDPFLAGKPENKLLLFWRMGLPTVASATPAYERAMSECGLSMACQGIDDWVETIEHYLGDEAARRQAAQQGQEHALRSQGEEALLAKWDEAVASALS
jgi:hypothetical protein